MTPETHQKNTADPVSCILHGNVLLEMKDEMKGMRKDIQIEMKLIHETFSKGAINFAVLEQQMKQVEKEHVLNMHMVKEAAALSVDFASLKGRYKILEWIVGAVAVAVLTAMLRAAFAPTAMSAETLKTAISEAMPIQYIQGKAKP